MAFNCGENSHRRTHARVQLSSPKANSSEISLSLVTAITLFAAYLANQSQQQQENFTVHAKRFRVVAALMSFALVLSCMAQTQTLADNASAVAQSRAPHGRVMSPGSSVA